MKAGTPFRRSLAMASAIQMLASMSLTQWQIKEKIAELGPYVSRGKGQNKSAVGSKKGAHMAFVRSARKLRNKKR
jgi:hypothetical protein